MNATDPCRVFKFSGFLLDPRQRLLFGKGGESIPLTSRAFDTLVFFVEHPDALLTKDMLMAAVWPDTIVAENNLSQCIVAVRRALGETLDDHKFIVTIPGRGYRFVAPVSPQSTERPALPAVAPRKRESRLLIALAGALAATLLLTLGYLLGTGALRTGGEAGAQEASKASVAVLKD